MSLLLSLQRRCCLSGHLSAYHCVWSLRVPMPTLGRLCCPLRLMHEWIGLRISNGDNGGSSGDALMSLIKSETNDRIWLGASRDQAKTDQDGTIGSEQIEFWGRATLHSERGTGGSLWWREGKSEFAAWDSGRTQTKGGGWILLENGRNLVGSSSGCSRIEAIASSEIPMD